MSQSTVFPEVLLFAPPIEADPSGSSFRSFHAAQFAAQCGRQFDFVQENHSCSHKNVLRGLHYQLGTPQCKLVRVIAGVIFDVVVDVRRHSASFGQWSGVEMSAESRVQRWVPEGFAHGFLVLSDSAEVEYKTTAYWEPALERAVLWDDPALGIDWPSGIAPILSAKDQAATLLHETEPYA